MSQTETATRKLEARITSSMHLTNKEYSITASLYPKSKEKERDYNMITIEFAGLTLYFRGEEAFDEFMGKLHHAAENMIVVKELKS